MGIAERRELPPHGFVEYEPAWLDSPAADALKARVLSDLEWHAKEIVLFGKRILQPRLIAWASELPYRYSGQTLEPVPPDPVIRELSSRVSARTRAALRVHGGARENPSFTEFNHVLLNRYRDGNDSMGMHADDEPELGPDPVVASVSLGAPRRFVLAPRRGGERLVYTLEHGSLLVMGGDCQKHHRHGIPKTAGAVGDRVSLTFRCLHAVPD